VLTSVLLRLGPATGTVATLSEVKTALRVSEDATEDDARLIEILRSQTRRYEDFTRRIMLPTPFEAQFACWSGLSLPAAPVRAVSEVAYLDADHAEQVLAAENWYLAQADDTDREVLLVEDITAPVLSSRPWPVRVRFTAGYNDPASTESGETEELDPDVADKIHILLLAQRLYDADAQMPEEEMRRMMGHRRVLR